MSWKQHRSLMNALKMFFPARYHGHCCECSDPIEPGHLVAIKERKNGRAQMIHIVHRFPNHKEAHNIKKPLMRNYSRRGKNKKTIGYLLVRSGSYWSKDLQKFVRSRSEATLFSDMTQASEQASLVGSVKLISHTVTEES